MLWVLKRTVSMRWFFWAPEVGVKLDGSENIHKFTHKFFVYLHLWKYYSKPVLSGHSKIDKTKILITNGSLMKVKSIVKGSILQYFWPALSHNRS